jgi:hypothetical protein
MSKLQNDIFPHRVKRTLPLLLSISIIGMLLASLGGVALSPAFGTATYDDVQVFARTTDIVQGSFMFAAYNSSGSLVSSTQTSYPAAAFELPGGNYLITVTALNQSQTYSYPIPLVESGASVASPSNSTDVVPTPYEYPYEVEYGFLVQQISGPTSLDIQTIPIQNITLTKVLVKVQFANGTAAANASVSASVVGAWYWWYGPDANLGMYAQTGADGIAQLMLPSVPVEVTAWDWIPVELPANTTSIPVNIGGETVNVTVYWQPTYVGLGGSALIVPPQDSATITLHVQEPTYWYVSNTGESGIMPPTVTSASAGTSSSAAISNSDQGVPAVISSQLSSSGSTSASALQTQISPITIAPQNPRAVTKGSGDVAPMLAIAEIVAVALAALGIGLVIFRGRRRTA